LQFIIYFIYDITFGFTGSPFVMGLSKMIFQSYLWAIVRCRIGSAAFPKTWVTSGIDFIILS
jgi:hypothetical protein